MNSPRPSFIVRTGEPMVIVPARVLALIETRTDIAKLRVQMRGLDPVASAALADMRLAALEWRSSAARTEGDPEPELAPRSKWQSTTAAGKELGISGRAVLKAIREDRLPAQQVAGRWRIATEDIEHFKAQRKAT